MPALDDAFDATWRVLVSFASADDARALAQRLEATSAVPKAGGSISFWDGSRDVFVYGPTSQAIEQLAHEVKAGIVSLGIRPSGVTVDQWITDSGRWSSETTESEPSDPIGTLGIVAAFVTELIWHD